MGLAGSVERNPINDTLEMGAEQRGVHHGADRNRSRLATVRRGKQRRVEMGEYLSQGTYSLFGDRSPRARVKGVKLPWEGGRIGMPARQRPGVSINRRGKASSCSALS